MSELSPGARQALEQARRGLEPSAARLAKVQAALERATVAPSAAPSQSAAGGSAGSSALGGKLLGAGAAIGIAAALTWLVVRQDVRGGVPAPQAPPVEAPTVSNAPTHAADAAPKDDVRPLAVPLDPERATPEARREDRGPAATRLVRRGKRVQPRAPVILSEEAENARAIMEPPAPAQAVAPASSPDAEAPAVRLEAAPRALASHEDAARPAPQERPRDRLRDEIKLIRAARAALARGEPARALLLLGEHAAQFSRGALREERLASEVMALCMSSRFDEADEKTKALARLPGSEVQVRELRAACPTLARRKKP